MILSKTPHKLGCVIKANPTSFKIDVSRSEFVEQILISAESNHKSGVELSCFELSQDSQSDFLKIQHTINPKIVFDMEIIKQQASQNEMDYFLQNGMWPWSQDVINLYTDAINRNHFIRT